MKEKCIDGKENTQARGGERLKRVEKKTFRETRMDGQVGMDRRLMEDRKRKIR